ncbi:MAG: hypothetical protein ACK5D5_03825 [Bacteroidota bacterium]|jgi:hypothetical protein
MIETRDPNKSDKEKDGSSTNILWAGISIALPILLIYLYSYSGFNFSFVGKALKKYPIEEENPDDFLAELNSKKKSTIDGNSNKKNGSSVKDSVKVSSVDTSKKSLVPVNSDVNYNITDSTKHRVLILGDSECGGLCFPLNDYCVANGHELAATIVWNSATIYTFAYADTLNALINKYKPTFIFFVVGLNELKTKELKRRKVASDLFLERIKGIPYAWIGPANFCEDYGLNKVFESAADSNAFFLSKDLDIPRGSDGRHPSMKGYRIWMDSIAKWINTKAKYKLAMKKPDKFNTRFKSKLISFNAAKYRGY